MTPRPHHAAEEISFKEIKDAASKLRPSKQIEVTEISQSLQAELQAKQLEVQIYGLEQFLGLQKDWASHIKWQIWAVLGFQFLFVILIGFNIGGFTDNLNKLPYMYVLVILQTLANIVALGSIVTRFLFPNRHPPIPILPE